MAEAQRRTEALLDFRGESSRRGGRAFCSSESSLVRLGGAMAARAAEFSVICCIDADSGSTRIGSLGGPKSAVAASEAAMASKTTCPISCIDRLRWGFRTGRLDESESAVEIESKESPRVSLLRKFWGGYRLNAFFKAVASTTPGVSKATLDHRHVGEGRITPLRDNFRFTTGFCCQPSRVYSGLWFLALSTVNVMIDALRIFCWMSAGKDMLPAVK